MSLGFALAVRLLYQDVMTGNGTKCTRKTCRGWKNGCCWIHLTDEPNFFATPYPRETKEALERAKRHGECFESRSKKKKKRKKKRDFKYL